MRIIEAEFKSTDQDTYNFSGCILNKTSSEPFHLRHEYYDKEINIKQSLYLFGKKPGENGTQVFIHKYFNYHNNPHFIEDLNFYKLQEYNFRLPNKEKLTQAYLLTNITGAIHCNQFKTKDGKYRRRIVYKITGSKDAFILVFSLDASSFSTNQLFKYVKNNIQISIE